MGTCTSREILRKSGECSESQGHFGREVKIIPPANRLVRNELRKKVQYHFPRKIGKARDSLSIIQISPKSVQ